MYPADLLASPDLLEPLRFQTRGGVTVTRRATALDPRTALDPVIDALDRRRGLLLSSGGEAPGRYRRHAPGVTDPRLAPTSRGRRRRLGAVDRRGEGPR
ncbi:anthranilate synthase component I, partial [Azospirillum brasilense]|nr:anthranilate synthase component I [Azospirillum brasilense]